MKLTFSVALNVYKIILSLNIIQYYNIINILYKYDCIDNCLLNSDSELAYHIIIFQTPIS